MKISQILLLGAAAVLLWQPCYLQSQPLGGAPATPPPADNGPTAGGTTQPHFQERDPRYKIQPNDILALSFPIAPEMNQTVTVQPDGFINLLSAGTIHIQGMTTPQVVDAVKKAYEHVLKDPVVNVDLKDFQKPFFVVLGQVSKPGQYDLRYNLTVAEAIAIGGGFKQEGRTQAFLFHRVDDDWAEVKEVKMDDFLHGKPGGEDFRVRPGDMIFVPEKFITKFKRYVPYSFGTGINPSWF